MEGLSVIIPVYNSAQILPELLERLSAVLPQCASSWEVILVNDGSLDNSWDAIDKSSKIYPWIKGINLMRNYGQHNALLCGIKAASYDVIITMDDDLQHPPAEIPKLIAKLGEGYDLVYGLAIDRQHESWRNLTAWLTYFVLKNIAGVDNANTLSAFRIFRTELRKAFAHYNGTDVYIDVLLSWGSRNFGFVPVKHRVRKSGVSNYNFKKLFFLAVNLITSFSTVPLQIASILGLIFTLFGGMIFTYVIIRYLTNGGAVPGFSFLAASMALFSGIQLFVLGIIGEYLARIHFRSMHHPSHVVRSTVGFDRGNTGE